MPVIYRIWASSCKPRLLSWRGQRMALGYTPAGRGALDEAFDLSLKVEELFGKGVPVAGVFLDCSKCYKRVLLSGLEAAARQAEFPESMLAVALNMYRGRRRVLVNGAVSSAYQARSGLPAGWVKDWRAGCVRLQKRSRKVKWIKAHTDRRTAAQHGVSEVDRQGNESADKAANNVLAPVDGWNA
eukprot:2328388-Amphidinium_carterae.1